ncbi:MAG: hypothetical protein PHO91_00740 [Patescibacteria group bacterium]|nr:hypothetical protein [Patescibacteria group bacterium]
MFKFKRKNKIKYRKLLEEYLIAKYARKISRAKFPTISYSKTQFKMF